MLTLLRGLSPLATLSSRAGFEGFLDRTAARARTFWFLVAHDTTGMTERVVLVPYLLTGWLVANVAATPLSLLVLRALGVTKEFRQVLGINFGILLTQIALFGVNWGLIGWGNRGVDHAVFLASLFPATLIAKWGLDVPFGTAVVHVLALAFLSLLLIFIGLCALAEFGFATL